MKNIRTSKFSKIIASYLAIQLILTTIQPANLLALTGGPAQPEFNSFTPIGTSDMVNLSSGDFNYNIPIMDVGGYPLNLSYDSGITMDQEATWVGLGWNLNIGQINRQVRGLPDDFKGEEVKYKNNLKPNKTKGMTFALNAAGLGIETLNAAGTSQDSATSLSLNAAITLEHNNYEGFSVTPSLGFGFDFAGVTSVGMNLSANAADGVTVGQQLGLSQRLNKESMTNDSPFNANISAGRTYNSRQGLTALSINTSLNQTVNKDKDGENVKNNTSLSAGASYPMINQTFTPIKRNRFHNTGFSFNPSVGFEFFGGTAEVGVTAFGNSQQLTEKTTTEKAYGYEYTKEASHLDVLDFNRENDRAVTVNTKILPTVNYTYDLYSIQGQGIGGQFRPYKSQVGYVFDQFVKDTGSNAVFGFEAEVGNLVHGGVDFKHTDTESHTGVWDTPGKTHFEYSNDTNADYEETYYKATGDLSVDNDNQAIQMYTYLGKENPTAIDILPNGPGRSFNREASSILVEKQLNPTSVSTPTTNSSAAFQLEEHDIKSTSNKKLIRSKRLRRNQAILKITNNEAQVDAMVTKHDDLNSHQTNGYRIVQPDGSTYIFGEAAVNTNKIEHTFAVDGFADRKTEGIVTIGAGDDSVNNTNGLDHYFNGIETPAYAHSYLLTSVLSSDYEDLTGDGPTDDDLGAYTKFHYTTVSSDYQWRVPYNSNEASYNPGLYTLSNDQKGSYTQGTKEIKYATTIETKTHVAFLDLSPREDGKAANDQSQYLINSIRLYSKPEALKANLLDDIIENDDLNIHPIKTAFFEYDYTLGQRQNSLGGVPNSVASSKGRLTLKKVYFTYRDSNMGKYTPYVFNYDNFNPTYHLKSYDVWGNYKPYLENQINNSDPNNFDIDVLPNVNDMSGCEVNQPITASEYPFVSQENKALQDYFASAWTLSSIDLPSGGKIELEYESDDYMYVQNRKAMQMYKTIGVSQGIPSSIANVDYSNLSGADYIIVALPNETSILSLNSNEQREYFKSEYLGENYTKPIYFNFMLNMTDDSDCAYEYVSGYFEIDTNKDFGIFSEGATVYAAIPMKSVSDEGSSSVNPITKAGWYFGRNNLKRFVYGVGDDTPENISFDEFFDNIGSSFATYLDIFRSPNGKLKSRGIASKFKADKSWIRLNHAGKGKLGGGLRVKKIMMHDNWETMLSDTSAGSSHVYNNFYGQEYNYQLEDSEISSGVSTFEPNASRENPFVEPYYNIPERIIAPKEVNYVEKPFGQSFFPAPSITYSHVTVSNLKKQNSDGEELKSNATGKVVNEFFTSKDFPTIASHTDVDGVNNYKDNLGSISNSILQFLTGVSRAKTQLVLSQGFSVVTNDMNGKTKAQKVYDEYGALISGVDYKYNTSEDGKLNNLLPVVKEDGSVDKALIGVQYDAITDFRESYNNSVTRGINTNFATFIIPTIPPLFAFIPSGFYQDTGVKTIYRGTTLTKHVHKTGILLEKEAYDLGARVKTKNVAWDAVSGQVLLTETTNEYNDNYYNFSYPAHWMYDGMGQAAENLGAECIIGSVSVAEVNAYNGENQDATTSDGENPGELGSNPSQEYTTIYKTECSNMLNVGDQVIIIPRVGTRDFILARENPTNALTKRYWVSENLGNGMLTFIDKDGEYLNPCGEDYSLTGPLKIKVISSRFKNMQSASMASVTSLKSPINLSQINNGNQQITDSDYEYDGSGENPKIVNASAVEYESFWQDDNTFYPDANGLGIFNNQPLPQDVIVATGNISYPQYTSVNPFVNNIKDQWRAVSSYAYLTGRNTEETVNTRNSGFFTSFDPYYLNNGSGWRKNTVNSTDSAKNWTFASQVTKYSSYGMELENKDALNRYSSALYGYNNTLPIAVASNTEHRQLYYNGFEDSINYADQAISEQKSHSGMRSLLVNDATSFSEFKAIKSVFNFKVHDNTDCVSRNAVMELDCEKFLDCPGGPYNISVSHFQCHAGNCDSNGCIAFVSESDDSDDCTIRSYGLVIINNIPTIPNTDLLIVSTRPFGPNNATEIFGLGVGYTGITLKFQMLNVLPPNDDGNAANIVIPATEVLIYYKANNTEEECAKLITFGGGQMNVGNNIPNQNENVNVTNFDIEDINAFADNIPEEQIIGELPTPTVDIPDNPEIDLSKGCYPNYLLPGEKYVVSAWVNSTALDPINTNENIGIRLNSAKDPENLQVDIDGQDIYPSGQIIDGWQRIIGIISIPDDIGTSTVNQEEVLNSSLYNFELFNDTDTDTYFDDIRVHPFNGTMKSFVYDEGTQRLMAELDENNYATFYEYDFEGGLVRVKKETERGIYTIQETRSSTAKSN